MMMMSVTMSLMTLVILSRHSLPWEEDVVRAIKDQIWWRNLTIVDDNGNLPLSSTIVLTIALVRTRGSSNIFRRYPLIPTFKIFVSSLNFVNFSPLSLQRRAKYQILSVENTQCYQMSTLYLDFQTMIFFFLELASNRYWDDIKISTSALLVKAVNVVSKSWKSGQKLKLYF